MSFDPVQFLENVERVFSSDEGLSAVRSWTRPTKLSTQVLTPEVSIELLAGSIDSSSLSSPNKQIEFYIRFVIFEEQTSSDSEIGSIYSGILDAVRKNPDLKDEDGKATCDYLGTFLGRTISFDLAATERNGVSMNAMKIDVPCIVREL